MLNLGNKEKSIEEIFIKYNQEIYRYFYFRTGSKELAEDLSADTFVKFLKLKNTYNKDKSSIRTWLYIIAKGILIDFYNKNKSNNFVNIEKFEVEDNSNNIDNKLLLDFLYKSLNNLSKEDRELFILKYINDLDLKTISSILKISYSNVKVRLFRLIKQLKKDLNE